MIQRLSKQLYFVLLFGSACTTSSDGNSSAETLSCGAGTSEVNGKCLAEAVCAEGTVLVDGECVVDSSNCPDGSALLNGICVADAPCADGTDEIDGVCVATLECGAGTEEQNGECVPEEEIRCSTGTFQDGERCKAEIYGEAQLELFEEQIALTYCTNLFSCCEVDSSFLTAFSGSAEGCIPLVESIITHARESAVNDDIMLFQKFFTTLDPAPIQGNDEAMTELLDALSVDENCTIAHLVQQNFADAHLQSASFADAYIKPALEAGDQCSDPLFSSLESNNVELCPDTHFCGKDPSCVEDCDDICRPRQTNGGECNADSDSEDFFLCESGLWCPAPANVCEVFISIFDPCGGPCPAGEYCHGSPAGTCRASILEGESCETESLLPGGPTRCATDLVCADTSVDDVDDPTFCVRLEEVRKSICDDVSWTSDDN